MDPTRMPAAYEVGLEAGRAFAKELLWADARRRVRASVRMAACSHWRPAGLPQRVRLQPAINPKVRCAISPRPNSAAASHACTVSLPRVWRGCGWRSQVRSGGAPATCVMASIVRARGLRASLACSVSRSRVCAVWRAAWTRCRAVQIHST